MTTYAGLFNDLHIHSCCPACASIFLNRTTQNSVCQISFPPHKERLFLFVVVDWVAVGYRGSLLHYSSYLLLVNMWMCCLSVLLPLCSHPWFAVRCLTISYSFTCVWDPWHAFLIWSLIPATVHVFLFRSSNKAGKKLLSIYNLWPHPSTFLVRCATLACASVNCALCCLSFPKYSFMSCVASGVLYFIYFYGKAFGLS